MRWRKLAVSGLLVCSLYLLAASAAVFVSGKWAMIGPVTAHLGTARFDAGVREGWPYAQFDNPANTSTTWPPRILVSFAGIYVQADRSRTSSNGRLGIHPLVGVIGALGLILYALRARRRLGQRRVGYCPDCNYDLRTTPNHCPECGWAAATARPPDEPLVGTIVHDGRTAITPTTFSTRPVASAAGAP